MLTTETVPAPSLPYNPEALRKLRAEYAGAIAMIDRLLAAEDRLAGGHLAPLRASAARPGELRGLARVAAAINAQFGSKGDRSSPARLAPMAASQPTVDQRKPLFGLARTARAINDMMAPKLHAGGGVSLVTLTAECGRNWHAMLWT